MLKRILTLLLLVILCASAAKAEDYVTAQALYDETRAPWQATYFFPNGENYAALSANYRFDVDLTPSAPNVERFPIFQVKMRPIELSEEALARFYQYDNAELRASFEQSRAQGWAMLKTGGIITDAPSADFFWTWYDEMDAARDNPLSPDDAAAIASGLWQRYLDMDNVRVRGVVGYDWEPRFYGEYRDSDTPEGRRMYTLDRGAYTVVGEAVLQDIPLLDTVTIAQERGPDYPQLGWQITLLDENRFIFQGSALEVVEEVHADVPLLPFSRIQEIYESTIVTNPHDDTPWEPDTPWTYGKPMIHVMSAELGYRLALAPGDEAQGMDTTYITEPVWILRGYVPEELWGGETLRQNTIAEEQTMLRHPRSLACGLYMSQDYMCIHAQTGEVLNWPNLGSNYWDLTADILTWEGM